MMRWFGNVKSHLLFKWRCFSATSKLMRWLRGNMRLALVPVRRHSHFILDYDLSDGTYFFHTDAPPFPSDMRMLAKPLIDALEQHRSDPIRVPQPTGALGAN